MRRLLSYILLFFVLFPTVSAQIPEGLLRSCPTVYQVNYGAQRILCTSGTAAEPDRDTGIAPSLHQFITNTTIPSIRLGSASITDTMPSASISYFYRVDTTRSHLFCTSFSCQIAYSPNAVGPKPEFSIRILDSNGTSSTEGLFASNSTLHAVPPIALAALHRSRLIATISSTFTIQTSAVKP